MVLCLLLTLAAASDYFVVRVADEATGRGVPLIELKLTNEVKYYTDSAGIAAIREPELEGKPVFVEISGHGYEYPDQTIMGRGVNLTLQAGKRADLKVKRTMIAERLYRLTGEGIYRDSALAELPVPTPPANGQVMGQDTAVAVPYAGKLFWIWGDTIGPAFWNFSVSGATSELTDDPATGIRYRYFTGEDGRVKKMLPLKEKGLVWIEGLFPVRDPQGRERLLATYTRQDGLKKPDECGVALYDDARQIFDPWVRTPCQRESHHSSHPILFEGYWYLYPWLRVPNQWEAVRDPAKWERREVQLPPRADRVACVAWNDYRKKFVLLMDWMGEVWYAEGPRPEGPYGPAVKIVQHDHYNFYNVVRHPFFDREGGRVVYFEGTYTDSFTDAKAKTPRYNYNQVMYRLRLDDPRLADAQQ